MPAVSPSINRSLAVLSGTPAFAEPLHVGRPNLGDRDALLARIGDILDRRWLSNDGPCVQEFERDVARYVGVKHCVAMCNATVGLEMAVRALGIGGEVIVPSYTFVATAHALLWQGITPVFVDIDSRTHNIDPDAIERAIGPKTAGILGVHLWGRACDTDAIESIARSRGLKVLYDAAHAFGCSARGRMIGSFGACEVFSFHATKFMNSSEGGAVVTNDDELAAKLRLMRNFGFAGYDRVTHLGVNGKMTEVCAAMGITCLEAIDGIVAINRRNHEAYAQGLAGIPGISLVRFDRDERNNYQYVVVEVDEAAAGLARDELVAVLHAENVLARRYFWPGCHRMEPYRSLDPQAGLRLAETERTAARVLVLPTGQSVSEAAVSTVCGIIRAACGQSREVRAALSASAAARDGT